MRVKYIFYPIVYPIYGILTVIGIMCLYPAMWCEDMCNWIKNHIIDL